MHLVRAAASFEMQPVLGVASNGAEPRLNCTPERDFASMVSRRDSARRPCGDRDVFMRARGIAFHFFPIVPRFAASPRLRAPGDPSTLRSSFNDNSRVDVTAVHIGGTWTKPAKQH